MITSQAAKARIVQQMLFFPEITHSDLLAKTGLTQEQLLATLQPLIKEGYIAVKPGKSDSLVYSPTASLFGMF